MRPLFTVVIRVSAHVHAMFIVSVHTISYSYPQGNPRFQAQIYRTLITLLSAPSHKAQQLSVYTLIQIQVSQYTITKQGVTH